MHGFRRDLSRRIQRMHMVAGVAAGRVHGRAVRAAGPAVAGVCVTVFLPACSCVGVCVCARVRGLLGVCMCAAPCVCVCVHA